MMKQEYLKPGDKIKTYCSKCKRATWHVYGLWPPLKCLDCYPQVQEKTNVTLESQSREENT